MEYIDRVIKCRRGLHFCFFICGVNYSHQSDEGVRRVATLLIDRELLAKLANTDAINNLVKVYTERITKMGVTLDSSLG